MASSIECFCDALCLLIEPPQDNGDLEKKFELNIRNACKKLSIEDIGHLSTLDLYGVKAENLNDVRWRWVVLALHIFISMKECGNTEETLLSVRQEKAVRTSLEFVISLGLLPSLLPGVGIPIDKRCSAATVEWVKGTGTAVKNPVSVIELYERLAGVTKVLLSLVNSGYFRGLVLSRHLSDLLAALCQLSMAPLKKPESDASRGGSKGNLVKDKLGPSSSGKEVGDSKEEGAVARIFSRPKEEINKKTLMVEIEEKTKPSSKPYSNFQMTEDFWNRLQVDRQLFTGALKTFVKSTHQPLLIRDLLLLQGSPNKAGEKGKPAPPWLRRGCASILNTCLFRKGGVIATVQAICDVFSAPQPHTDSWAQHMVLGKLITMAISSKKDDKEWCGAICSQVIELLSADNLKNCKDYARAGVTCICMLLASEEKICQTNIIDPLMEPLKALDSQSFTPDGISERTLEPDPLTVDGRISGSASSEPDRSEQVLISEVAHKRDGLVNDSVSLCDINHCLSVLDFCFVENDPGMSLPLNLMAPAFRVLLREYRDKRLGSESTAILTRLLVKFITSCPDDSVLYEALDSVLFVGCDSFECLKNMAEKEGSNEDTCEPKNLEEIEERLLKDLMEKHLNLEKIGKVVEEIGAGEELGWGSSPILELVSAKGNGQAAEVVFRYVLQALPKGGENAGEHGDWLVSIAKQSVATQLLCHLLEVPSVNDQVRRDPKDVVSFLGNFLAKEAEKVFKRDIRDEEKDGNSTTLSDEGIGRNSDPSLLNVSGEEAFPSILDLGLNESDGDAGKKAGEDSQPSGQSHSEFVLVTLLILKSLCEAPSGRNEQEWWAPFRQILPQVRAFRRESSCPEVRAMAEDVACAILTRGKSGSKKTGATVRTKQSQDSFSKELGNKSVPSASKKDHNEDLEEAEKSGDALNFEEAVAMAQENAVHLRGHALISLTKLLSSKDPVAMRNQTMLLQIFQENLKHDDSYIYLAAINGLEKLGYIFPDQVLETLSDEFAEISVVQAGNEAFNDVRLKVGEALLRVTRTLGEMAPKYSCLLLNSFLGGVRDGDGMVRASSLSNLGEVCKILSFRLGPIATEVLWCVRCVLETDCVAEARRAAVLVVTLLLQGMGVEVFKVLETILPELYRTLKSVRSNDPDEVVQLHAQLALEEVDRVTLQFLFPPQKLEKKIFVLDPPS
ncbi:transport and Golgi organization protein 6 homolog [Ischnura elegans]|uniref:transport and Golgi organization protein 6 homolog n=1 Tax=Ischnura elegans TaxID=197161 RepID=UPI001ED893AB|nr:transport and Golgi organization protein 6 homolog [Ischnura elegans]XP_046385865.1 transport and Golgi organization protein 6 homolog [Ischnura elegans]